MTEPEFRKSSFCGTSACVEVAFTRSSYCGSGSCVEVGFTRSSHCTHGNCVEVGHDAGDVLVRDGKNPEAEPLRFDAEEWRAFLAQARDGEFDA